MIVSLTDCKKCPKPIKPPPCDTLTCPEGYQLIKSEFNWECVKPVPPSTPKPEDYLKLVRVGSCQDVYDYDTCTDGLLRQLNIDLTYDAWIGWRDPLYFADNCSGLCSKVFGMTPDELNVFGAVGQSLEWGLKQGDYFRNTLSTLNRHGFQGRSMVRKDVWKDYNQRLQAHLVKAKELVDTAQKQPIRDLCSYDTLRGFCNCSK